MRKNKKKGKKYKSSYETAAYKKYYDSRSKNVKKGFFEQIYDLAPETKKAILSIFFIIFGLVLMLGLMGIAGSLGDFLNHYLSIGFGFGKFYFPVILIVLGYFLARSGKYSIGILHYIGLVIFLFSANGFFHIFRFHQDPKELLAGAFAGMGGGLVGWVFSYPLFIATGFLATLLILLGLMVISLFLLFNTSFTHISEKRSALKEKFGSILVALRLRKAESSDDEEEEDDDEEVQEDEESLDVDVETDVASKEVEDEEETEEEGDDDENEILPEKVASALVSRGSHKIDMPLSLLSGKAGKPSSGDIKANQRIIKKTLETFKISVEMGEVSVGPTVTQYTLRPAEGVKLSRILSLNDNLALALAAHPIRIEAPIPGKNLVGIEVPNQQTAVVPFKSVLDNETFLKRESDMLLTLGEDVKGNAWLADLTKMPHVLIAGATNSGKSVCINTLILGLLFQNSPDMLKLIMVDPKRVELPGYNGIPHLITPVITNTKKTINALRWCIGEMERRFERLQEFHKRNIQAYNASIDEKMPYIVIVIDELADLMITSGPEVEAAITRLAQMSRAVGIHLIIATQRPSVDVLTGLIKANVPSRIAFSVASAIDSRTILDTSGAEKLLGRGDMLFMSADVTKPKRLQGAYATDEEIKRVIRHIKKQGRPDYIEDVTEKQTSGGMNSGGFNDADDLLGEAWDVILKAGKASATLLQRRLRVGYARAARLLDLLEEQGYIGPSEGAKPREIKKDSPNTTLKQKMEQDIDEDEYDEEQEEEESEEDDTNFGEQEDNEDSDADADDVEEESEEFEEDEYEKK